MTTENQRRESFGPPFLKGGAIQGAEPWAHSAECENPPCQKLLVTCGKLKKRKNCVQKVIHRLVRKKW
jgi:hypothetical protein